MATFASAPCQETSCTKTSAKLQRSGKQHCGCGKCWQRSKQVANIFPFPVVERYIRLSKCSYCCQVFIECSGTEDDAQDPWVQSKFYKILDRFENTIRVNIGLPPYTQGEPLQTLFPRHKVSAHTHTHTPTHTHTHTHGHRSTQKQAKLPSEISLLSWFECHFPVLHWQSMLFHGQKEMTQSAVVSFPLLARCACTS